MDTKLIKQKILDLAIRGKLVPQNPADEPASVLLERIKAEKAQLIKEGKIKKEKPLPPIEEVPFEIPESWEWCRLGSICSKFSTGPFGSMVHKTDYVLENGIPMINPANIINGSISKNKLMLVSIERSNELLNYRLNIDDVILARRGDLSKCAIISSQQEGWLCGTGSFFMHLLELEPRFFQVIFATSDIQSYLSSESVGATMDNLNQGLLSNMVIPIPPLEKQKRIVAEIDRWFKWIDELEQNQQDLHTAIKQAKSKILDLAIHGKLVPQDVNKSKLFNLLDVAELLSGRDLPNSACNDFTNGMPYLIGASNIVNGKIQFIRWTSKPEVISKVGDTLLSCKGTIGTVVKNENGDIHIARQFMALRPKREIIDENYLCLFITAIIPLLKEKAHGVIPGIARDDLKEINLLLPSINQQIEITNKVSRIISQLEKIEKSLN